MSQLPDRWLFEEQLVGVLNKRVRDQLESKLDSLLDQELLDKLYSQLGERFAVLVSNKLRVELQSYG